MTSTAPRPTPADPADPADPAGYPRRFAEGAARNRRIGSALRRVARVAEVDAPLMDRIGAAMTRRDEGGARLAQAMRLRAGDPGRVAMSDLSAALEGGIAAVADPAPALCEFITTAEDTPDWVDWDLVDRGARAYRRFGRNAADVLLSLALIGGYRFGGPPDLLVATGGLVGDSTRLRLAQTQQWALLVSTPGAMRPHQEAWRLTLHVRAMHALVNDSFEPRWDCDRWGLPINQADQAATLGLFDAVALLGVRAMGVPVPAEDSHAVMHLWRYVGWLMGVEEEWLVDSERERHRVNYHVLLAQGGLSDAGPRLAQAIVRAQGELAVAPFAGIRRRYARERLLSLLTVLLGPLSMRELGLPMRPPWAIAMAWVSNTVRYRVLGRSRAGQARVDRWADRGRERLVASYFGEDSTELARLRV